MQTSITKNQKINLEDAVSLLGVSSATVRNWIKHDYLTPESDQGKKLIFDSAQVQDLKQKINSGEINRLNKRANKKHSTNTFIPDEYAANYGVINFVEGIIDSYREKSLDRNTLLFSVILNLLEKKGLVSYSKPKKISELVYKNNRIREELSWWLKNTADHLDENDYSEFSKLELPEADDLLGLIYQSLAMEGHKAQGGSYYTPKSVVQEIVDEYARHDSVVLDPCCGTGQFLLSAAEKVTNPENIWGFDIDEMAVRLARLNLLTRFPDKDFSPNIFHKNTLLHSQLNGLFAENIPAFDLVITNPPWGVHFTQTEIEQLQELYPSVQSGEAFSYFLNKSLHFLKKGGVLSFILPESILNIKAHRDIREMILTESRVQRIKYMDRVFKNVFTPVVRLDVTKEIPSSGHIFQAEKTGTLYPVEQSRLIRNHDYVFDVFSDDQDMAIINKVYALEHLTLAGKAEWALGVVTGDNKKHLAEKRTKTAEPILTGKDIKRFVTNEPKNFIEFDAEKFQQVAPEAKYRAQEKLIYKFISKELVFAYDDQQTLTLNSANILIPKISGYPVKTILALLNSSLYQFVHQKKFASLKVLRSDIEKLPLPVLSKKQHQEIVGLVDELLDKKISTEKRKDKYVMLDSRISDIFSLDEAQKAHVVSNTRISDKLLSIE